MEAEESVEMKTKSLKILSIFACGLLLSACAATQTEGPTHYWDGVGSAKTQSDYRSDNLACSGQSQADSGAAMDTDSLSFENYRDCMVEKGYVLRTY